MKITVAKLGRPTALAFAALVAVQVPPARAGNEITTMAADDFLQSIGVCVHMPYTDGAYVNVQNVLQDLKFLGVKRVRDQVPGMNSSEGMRARDILRRMVFDDIKFDLFVSGDWKQSGTLEFLRNLGKARPNSVEYVEGFNEINNFPATYAGQSGAAAAIASQKAIYAAIKADNDLKDIRIIDMTGLDEVKNDAQSRTTLAGFADLMNYHAYAQNGQQPASRINSAKLDAYKSMEGVYPKAITEFGYASMPESGWLMIGVDERTQAKGILNGLFDATKAGYRKTYIYELLDEKPDDDHKDREFHFGLFSFDNHPKMAAVAISRMTKLLSGDNGQVAPTDQGAHPGETAAKTAILTVTAPPSEPPVASLLLVKPNGSQIGAIWRETDFWDRATGKPLEAAPVKADISFKTECRAINVYDVLQSDKPVSSAPRGHAISLMVSDHVQLVECSK